MMNGDNGGRPAVLAVVRWATRLFRREWRQQILVLALMTLTVAAAVGFASVAYNAAPGPANAEFGTANHLIVFDDPSAEILSAQSAAALGYFGTIDVIGHRDVPLPGATKPVDYRAQNPEGPYSGPMLELRDGHYPTSDVEAAVTDGLATDLELRIGGTLSLDGVERTITGVVENPSDLHDEFVLLEPSAVAMSDSLTVLVDATEDEVQSFRAPTDASRITSSRGDLAEDVVAAVIVLAVGAVALLFVALVASAGFMVMAQRRQHQLGLLSAIGATEKHLRFALITNGTLLGSVAAVVGAAAGLVGWVLIAPRLEPTLGFRIDPVNVPWWLVASAMVAAIAASTGAAYWPARIIARTSTVQALSGRPTAPNTARRSAAAAAGFVGFGMLCLGLAGEVADDTSFSPTNALLVATGVVSTIVGMLLISPVMIRVAARSVSNLSVAVRLSLRDLGRYQARSGAALAAISMAIGVSVAVVAIAAASEHREHSGNLSDRQLLVRVDGFEGPILPDLDDIQDVSSGVDRLMASLDDPTVVPLDVALDESIEPWPEGGREAVSIAVADGDFANDVSLVYIAKDELLEPFGVSLDAAGETDDILTVETRDVFFVGVSRPEDADGRDPEQITGSGSLEPRHTSLPGTFMTPDDISERGWTATPSGQWLITVTEPLTADQRTAAREIAAGAGLALEWRDGQGGLGQLRAIATIVGILLALAVLAMTVGLVRSEAVGDLRILTAAGASSRTRRWLTAFTAASLAALGVVLGTLGAYTTMIAGGVNNVLTPGSIPLPQLAIICIGTPVVALLGGFVIAGREPTSLTRRHAIE
jgi:putative ABC transport system permease protein